MSLGQSHFSNIVKNKAEIYQLKHIILLKYQEYIVPIT